MKKVLAILLATLLIISMMAFGASAETPSVTVVLDGSTQAITGEKYEVTLLAPKTVGGISGVIDYDETKFDLIDIKISAEFAAVNRINADEGTSLIKDDGDVIKFALLADTADNDAWVTFIFDVLDTAEVGDSSFTLKDVESSDAAGISLITEGLTTVPVIDAPIYAPAISVAGATIRTNGEADIRFEADFSSVFESEYRNQIAEVGIVGIPTSLMSEGQELVIGGKYSGYSPKIGRIKAENLNADTTTISTKFKNSASSAALLRTKYSARAYIKLTNGTIIYSDNEIVLNNVSGGTSSRSCIDVARSIAAQNGVTDADEGAEVLALADSKWTVNSYKELINTINTKIF